MSKLRKWYEEEKGELWALRELLYCNDSCVLHALLVPWTVVVA
jgi:hypothetical protein